MRQIGLLWLLVLGMVWGGSSQASLVRRMSLAEMVTASDEIVVGTVVSVTSAWDAARRKILSTVEVSVEERWKGSDGGHVEIVQLGGTVGDIEMTVHGMPRFSPGEKSLLFLQGHGPRRVVGMAQGRRPLIFDQAQKQWLVDSPDNDGVVELGRDGKLRHAMQEPRMPLFSLHQLVLALTGGK
jgi:hypothetical protein